MLSCDWKIFLPLDGSWYVIMEQTINEITDFGELVAYIDILAISVHMAASYTYIDAKIISRYCSGM